MGCGTIEGGVGAAHGSAAKVRAGLVAPPQGRSAEGTTWRNHSWRSRATALTFGYFPTGPA